MACRPVVSRRATAKGKDRFSGAHPLVRVDGATVPNSVVEAWLYSDRMTDSPQSLESGQAVEVQLNLNGVDVERLVVIGGDLEFLRDLPRERLLTHTEVRLAAGILRRLLLDGQLSALWRQIGQIARAQPAVTATYIDGALSEWPQRWVKYAWAGGASTGGAQHTGFILAAIPREEHEKYESPDAFLEAHPLPYTGERKLMRVDDWLATTSAAIQTNELGLVAVSRGSVLRYIANRKGGVHFDPARDFSVPPGKKRTAVVEYSLLDHGLLRVGHLSGPEYEIASMAQVVADSDWALQFIDAAKRLAPEDFAGDPLEMKFWTGLREADGTGWATSRFGAPPSEDSPSAGNIADS